jgi:hypothetical protein
MLSANLGYLRTEYDSPPSKNIVEEEYRDNRRQYGLDYESKQDSAGVKSASLAAAMVTLTEIRKILGLIHSIHVRCNQVIYLSNDLL